MDEPEEMNNIKQLQSVTLPWLPKIENVTSNQSNKKVLTKTLRNDEVKILFFRLFENSLPLYLHKRFHTMNTSELDKIEGDDAINSCNFSSISSFNVTFHEVFGVGELNVMFKEYNEYLKVKGEPNYKKTMIFKNMKSEINCILNTTSYGYVTIAMKPIRDSDLCKASSDILLLPHVIIQLPWKPSVFHQWLVAALSEVLIFEKQSLELRHWPLTIFAQETATELFKLISQFKERITLGFMLLAKVAESYPNTDVEIPGYIMNAVVLPSLPVLKYLITGRAHQVMKILKKICWSNFENSDQIHFVSLKSYSLDQALDDHFTNIPYNFPLWLNNTFNHPLPTGPREVSDIIERLQSKSQILPDVKTVIPSNGQELALYNIFKEKQENKETAINNENMRSLAIHIVKEHIIEKGKLPGLDINQVNDKFNSQESKASADEILNENKTGDIHNALRQALMYQTACDLITKFEEKYSSATNENIVNKKEKYSAIGRIILMQLESVQREQIVKLTQTCGVIFKIGPCIPNIQNVKVVSYDAILQNIAAVNSEIRDKKYSQVLSELPSEWQKPVKYKPSAEKKSEFLNESSSSEKVAKKLEDRIGILLYNIAKDSPKIHQNGGGFFPDWHIVQYILPCFVTGYMVENKMQQLSHLTGMCSLSPFIGFESNKKGLQNYLKFVHAFISYYEEQYKSWLKNPIQKIIPVKELELKSIIMIYGLIIDKFRSHIRLIVNAHTDENASYMNGLTIFDTVIHVVSIWPCGSSSMFETKYETDVLIKNWFDYAYDFFNTILIVARQAWGPPIPGTIIPRCPKLGELFYANAVICELDLIVDIIRTQNKKADTPCSEELFELQNEIKEIRLDTYRKVIHCETHGKENLRKFVIEKKKRVLHFYKLMKKFYFESRPITRSCLFEKIPCNTFQPEVKNAVIYYMNGNFDALDNLLTVFDFPVVKKCRKCSISEAISKTDMIVCDICIEQKYPDIHYFCSLACKDAYWQSNHMVDHLEFETGVSDLIKSDE